MGYGHVDRVDGRKMMFASEKECYEYKHREEEKNKNFNEALNILTGSIDLSRALSDIISRHDFDSGMKMIDLMAMKTKNITNSKGYFVFKKQINEDSFECSLEIRNPKYRFTLVRVFTRAGFKSETTKLKEEFVKGYYILIGQEQAKAKIKKLLRGA